MGNSNVAGRDMVPTEYTPTAILGKMASESLSRMIDGSLKSNNPTPFSLSVHFNAPHPPMVAPGRYMQYYWKRRGRLFIPPSLSDTMQNTAYEDSSKKGSKVLRAMEIAELASCYYGMIEEVDQWVGKLLKIIENAGIKENTLVIFSSDHGEMVSYHVCCVLLFPTPFLVHASYVFYFHSGLKLGAHGLLGKVRRRSIVNPRTTLSGE